MRWSARSGPMLALVPFAVVALLLGPPVVPGTLPPADTGRAAATPSRGLSTDRPDVTESPYTVPPGRLQLEASFVEYARTREADAPAHAVTVLPVNLKVGLHRNLDFQLGVTSYVLRTPGDGAPGRAAGVGDVAMRAKLNLVGNDGGQLAMALMPFVRLPTGAAAVTTGRYEGGLVLPIALRDLPGGFDLGTMVELDVTRHQGDAGYGLDVVHSMTLGHALIGDRSAFYLEYAGAAGIHTGQRYAASANGGVTYSPASNLQFDGGIMANLSQPTGGYTLFAGFAFRT